LVNNFLLQLRSPTIKIWCSHAFFLPILIIIVCYGKVLAKISDTVKLKNDVVSHHSARLKKKAERMVGYLITTFLICRGPFFFCHMMATLVTIPVPDHRWCSRMHDILIILIYVRKGENITSSGISFYLIVSPKIESHTRKGSAGIKN
jgi:hypothetical protein